MKKAIITVLLLALAQPALMSAQKPAQRARQIKPAESIDQVTIKDVAFRSPAMGRDMHYRIILPVGYEKTNRRYPTLYLLHGLTGGYRDWESRTFLTMYATKYPLIIVMPDGEDGWYTNWAGVAENRYEDYIMKDLIPEVDRTYRTINTSFARAIAGLSMGGYGAAKFALKYSGSFKVVGTFSGALDAASDPNPPYTFRDLPKVFADTNRADNDLMQLVGKVKQPSRVPYFYVSCGSADPLLPSNREFLKQLSVAGIPYEYHEAPGAHTWSFWDDSVREFLEKLPAVMPQAGATWR